jgi:hypothetical protein
MVDMNDDGNSGTRINMIEMIQSICVVNSPCTSRYNKTATGFVIEVWGFYCLMTTAHVITSFEDANHTFCYFGYNSRNPVDTFLIRLNPNIIYWSSPQSELDCVIVAFAVQTVLPINMRPFTPHFENIQTGNYIQVWGHPNLDNRPMQQSTGKLTKIANNTFHYRANTMDGFSGSPVTSIETGHLVALHCGGPTAKHPTCGNTGSCIHTILDLFHTQFSVSNLMSSQHRSSYHINNYDTNNDSSTVRNMHLKLYLLETNGIKQATIQPSKDKSTVQDQCQELQTKLVELRLHCGGGLQCNKDEVQQNAPPNDSITILNESGFVLDLLLSEKHDY